MKLHDRFAWDPVKEEANHKKHGVTFDDAAAVLADEEADTFHVEEYDDEHSTDEDRYITPGSDPADRRIILRISWTDRSEGAERMTRIISARSVTPRERKRYAKEISGG